MYTMMEAVAAVAAALRENASGGSGVSGGGGGNAAVNAEARDLPQTAALLPPPVASTWPPLMERLERKSAAVEASKAAVEASKARSTAARAAGDQAEMMASARALFSEVLPSLSRAGQAVKNEIARQRRLQAAGLQDPTTGDALPLGPPASLPLEAMRQICWNLPRGVPQHVLPLVCSAWARLPLEVRACCESARYGEQPYLPRLPAVPADAAKLSLWLCDEDGSAAMPREYLAAVLGGSSPGAPGAPGPPGAKPSGLRELTVRLKLEQLPELAESLAARGAPHAALRRLTMLWHGPPPASAAAAAAARSRARMEAVGASLARSAPALEWIEFHVPSFAYAAARALLLSLLSSGGARTLREVRFTGDAMTSAFVARLEEAFAIRKLAFLPSRDHAGIVVPRFPPSGSGISRTLRELRFEVRMGAFAAAQRRGGGGRGSGPRAFLDVGCDEAGVSAEQALAPLADAVTRLDLDLISHGGPGIPLPRVFRLPACFNALRGVQALFVYYPWSSADEDEMESPVAATVAQRASERAAERAAAAAGRGGGADIVLAKARSWRQQLPAAPLRPWDLLSQLTELDIRFLLGNYELVLPSAGMPNLRYLDMRGIKLQTPRRSRGGGGGGVEGDGARRRQLHPWLPPPPSVVPNLEKVLTGWFPRAPREEGSTEVPVAPFFGPRDVDLSALVPAGSVEPYARLRELTIDDADLIVGGGGGRGTKGKDDEIRRIVVMFPVLFPSLKILHVHDCLPNRDAERVLAGLKEAYAAAKRWRARGGGAASSSSSPSSPDDDDEGFLGICRNLGH